MHLKEAITWADLPAVAYGPGGEDLRAIIVSVGVVAEDYGND
jgi:hypothetical protein